MNNSDLIENNVIAEATKEVIIPNDIMTSKNEIQEEKINCLDFDDYREFLKAWYNSKKKTRYGYSYQRFSQKAGFASPNFFKQIVDGHRNLSEESLNKFLQVLELSEGESRYFRALVYSSQASDEADRDIQKKQMELIRKTYAPMVMSEKHAKVLGLWYSFAIRELIMHVDYDGTHEWICEKMGGKVNLEQVDQALKLLQDVGLVATDESGKLVQSDPVTFMPGALSPKEVAAYHRQMLSIINNVLMNDRKPFGQNDRIDISSLTLGVKKSKIPLIKNKIAQFRKEILSMVAEDTQPDDVILVSLQMVPLTK